jgi:hypothetical protein
MGLIDVYREICYLSFNISTRNHNKLIISNLKIYTKIINISVNKTNFLQYFLRQISGKGYRKSGD